MKMKIDAQVLKEMRNKKCWSQEQLAEISSLSLRTVQRIESKGVASQESIKSLASVLEVSCEALLPKNDIQEDTSEDHTGVASSVMLDQSTTQEETASTPAVDKKRLKAHYMWGLFFIIAANVFGLLGIYEAYNSQKIDFDTMQLLKNIVSASLLISTAVVIYKGWKKGIFNFDL